MRLVIFGYGYAAQALTHRLAREGWSAAATIRRTEDASRLKADNVRPLPLNDDAGLGAALREARAVLITAPPGLTGCPALPVIAPLLARAQAFPDWLGYLSTTGVYGDRRGRWVFETSRLAARSVEGARRVAAERDWLQVGRGMGLTTTVFRLPGIYGPGRSALDRVRRGEGRRMAPAGQVFSRIHVDDLAGGLAASIAKPRPGGIYNLCDDEPCPSGEVLAYAAELLGAPPPPETPLAAARLSPRANRFYAESKRVSNARAKAELAWRPMYPSYREGLRAVLEAETSGLL